DGDTVMGGTKEDMERMEDQPHDYNGSDMEHDRSDEEKDIDSEADEDDTFDQWDDERTGEPNIIHNENEFTYWGRCYFEALEQDPDFNTGTIREPFYRNEDGFILKRHPHQPSRVYIPRGRVRI